MPAMNVMAKNFISSFQHEYKKVRKSCVSQEDAQTFKEYISS